MYLGGALLMAQAQSIFSTVSKKDHFSFFKNKEPDYDKVVSFFDFKRDELAKATGVPTNNVRFDTRMPQELQERLQEWAVAVNLVAEHFGGDLQKTSLWFRISNPLLGNVSPRDMIRFGRFRKLLKFIQSSLGENAAA